MSNDIINSLKEVSDKFTINDRSRKGKHIPGWNDYVKEAHARARDAFIHWQVNDKPRQGPIHVAMLESKANFKRCLRFCKSIKDKAIADSIAKSLLLKDGVTFWKEVKKLGKSGANSLASSIDGAVGENNICNIWKDHYENLLNSNTDFKDKTEVLNNINLSHMKEKNVTFTNADVKVAIKNLKMGKSAGFDGIFAEHFKYADDIICTYLSMLFNAMIMHGYIPNSIMYTIIVPIVKDKKALLNSKDNYRPVALTSIISKILEIVLLNLIEDELQSNFNQFGFKKKLGADICIFSLQQIIEFYKSQNTPVYVCFLDASKAFDRVNHWTLFKKLLKRKLPILIVRLIVFWYTKQECCVRWGSSLSNPFNVTNGVRQGGILSPILFNLYMNDLSIMLNESKIGCKINGRMCNHLMYADDTCIVAPCPSALKKLLDICCVFAEQHSVKFNGKKSKYICFKTKSCKKMHVPNMSLGCEIVPIVEKVKYLGVIITSQLDSNDDIARHTKCIYTQGNILISKFRYCSESVKICLFKTFISSMYGSQIWTVFNDNVFKKASVAYNNVFRHLLAIPKGVSMSQYYMFNGVDHFKVLYRKAIGNFRCRLLSCNNLITRDIVQSVFFKFYSSHSVNWRKHLF